MHVMYKIRKEVLMQWVIKLGYADVFFSFFLFSTCTSWEAISLLVNPYSPLLSLLFDIFMRWHEYSTLSHCWWSLLCVYTISICTHLCCSYVITTTYRMISLGFKWSACPFCFLFWIHYGLNQSIMKPKKVIYILKSLSWHNN